MKDLAIVQPYTLLSFESMVREGNFLRFRGPADYRKVITAVINEFVIDEVALYGNDLLVYIPSGLDTEDIRYVALIAVETASSTETLLRVGLGAIPSEITGPDRLIQLFVKVLYQTPGTDIFYRDVGGGLLGLKRRGTTGDLGALSAEIAAAVRKAERDVKSMQAGMRIPSDERLVQMEVLKIRPDSGTGDINVLLALTTVGGSKAYFNVAG